MSAQSDGGLEISTMDCNWPPKGRFIVTDATGGSGTHGKVWVSDMAEKNGAGLPAASQMGAAEGATTRPLMVTLGALIWIALSLLMVMPPLATSTMFMLPSPREYWMRM